MREYPNVLKKSLEKDEQFNIEVQSAVIKLFNAQNESIFKNDNFDAKLINVDEHNRYLFVKDLEFNVMAVYHQGIDEYNQNKPFEYALSGLKERGDIYYTRIVSFETVKDPEAERKDYIRAMYEKYGMDAAMEKLGIELKELLAILTDTKSLLRYREGKYSVSSSPYELNTFCKFIGVERDSAFWAKHSQELNELIKGQLDGMLINIAYMQEIAEKNNFNPKNRFDYNDLDNHLWKVGKGVALDDQNLGFYCVTENKDVTIYAWDKGSNHCKKHTELETLIAEIDAGNTVLIDSVALKIENGKAVFVDNALIYSLVLDIQGTVNSLIEDGHDEPKFPVDIYSYPYQLAFYQKKYGYDEFNFMNQAIMTLGSGFYYNEETGRFCDSSVTYDPTVTTYEHKNLGKATSIYGYPKEFTKLDSDWHDAIKRILVVLKEDRPLPIMGKDEKEKNQKLDEIIKFYEDGLSKLENKLKSKM